jgi:RNA polymerase primary sigma factor
LFDEFNGGNEEAFSKIIQHNLRFVVSVSKKYQNMGLGLTDLINEGNVGLMKAARRFDTSKGFKFISYAVWWIRQCILQALSDKGRKIRIPLNVTGNMNKVRRMMNEIHQREERDATEEELAEATELSIGAVRRCLKNYKKCSSLDAPISDDGRSTLVTVIEDDDILQPDHGMAVVETQQKDVQTLLDHLPDRESTVLSMYYGIGRPHPVSLGDISDHVGLSSERIRQIKDRAIAKLRVRSSSTKYMATYQ